MVQHCLCRGPDDGSFMIQCDTCGVWYHARCIGMSVKQGKQFRNRDWHCHKCSINSHTTTSLQAVIDAKEIANQNLRKLNEELERKVIESLDRERERTAKLKSFNDDLFKALQNQQSEKELFLHSLKEALAELNEGFLQMTKESESLLNIVRQTVTKQNETNEKLSEERVTLLTQQHAPSDKKVNDFQSAKERVPLVPQKRSTPSGKRINEGVGSKTETKKGRLTKSQPANGANDDDDDNIFMVIKPCLPKPKKLSLSLV